MYSQLYGNRYIWSLTDLFNTYCVKYHNNPYVAHPNLSLLIERSHMRPYGRINNISRDIIFTVFVELWLLSNYLTSRACTFKEDFSSFSY